MKSCAKEPNLCSTTHLESTEFSAKKGERLHSPQTSLLKGVTRAIKLGEGWRFSEFRRWQMRDNIQRPTPRRIEETHAIYWLRGSPVGRNANPSNVVPDASASLIFSGLAPARAAASRKSPTAEAGVLAAGNRKIQGTSAEVKALSLLKATTGTKHFSASCSERWLASRSNATIAKACSSIKAWTNCVEAAPQFCVLSTGRIDHSRPPCAPSCNAFKTSGDTAISAAFGPNRITRTGPGGRSADRGPAKPRSGLLLSSRKLAPRPPVRGGHGMSAIAPGFAMPRGRFELFKELRTYSKLRWKAPRGTVDSLRFVSLCPSRGCRDSPLGKFALVKEVKGRSLGFCGEATG